MVGTRRAARDIQYGQSLGVKPSLSITYHRHAFVNEHVVWESRPQLRKHRWCEEIVPRSQNVRRTPKRFTLLPRAVDPQRVTG